MNIIDCAKKILTGCMDVKPEETVLVVTDDNKIAIGQAFYEAAKQLGCEALLMTMKEREYSGQEPPKPVADAMLSADVVLCPTAKSLTHTNAKIAAAKNGARIGTMPNIAEEMLYQGAMTADYARVEELTGQVTELLTSAKTARIEKEGYVLNIDLEGRKGVPSTGVYRTKGAAGNLPSGEAYIAPLENGSNGEMKIDGSMVGLGKLEEPLFVKVENGKLKEIRGKRSEELSVLLANENNATLGELGIGTNEKAILCGVILEDEKVYGTVHIAFGTNVSFGGTVKADCHMDGIILKPDLYLDDRLIIKGGEFQI